MNTEIPINAKMNFETIVAAAKADQLVLKVLIHKNTGKKSLVICCENAASVTSTSLEPDDILDAMSHLPYSGNDEAFSIMPVGIMALYDLREEFYPPEGTNDSEWVDDRGFSGDYEECDACKKWGTGACQGECCKGQ